MYSDVCVLILCFIWVKVLVPVYICVDEYGDGFWILFCRKSGPMNGLRYSICMWKVCYSITFSFIGESITKGSKDFITLEWGKKCFSEIEQVMGEEK